MNAVFQKVVFIACGIAMVLLAAVTIWQTILALEYSAGFEDYPHPYHATVIGFADRSGVRVTSHAPIVQVVPRQGPSFSFTSHKFGNLNWVSTGDSVEIVHKPTKLPGTGYSVEVFEIKGAYHLWLRDVMACVVIVGFPMLLFLVTLPAEFFNQWRRDRRIFGQAPRALRR